MSFGETCQTEEVETASFYGSTCIEMAPQLRMFDSDVSFAEVNGETPPAAQGIGFWLTIAYLMGLLPLIAVGIFFFKRLSVNKLLKRVAIAAGSAIGLVAASAAFASVFGS